MCKVSLCRYSYFHSNHQDWATLRCGLYGLLVMNPASDGIGRSSVSYGIILVVKTTPWFASHRFGPSSSAGTCDEIPDMSIECASRGVLIDFLMDRASRLSGSPSARSTATAIGCRPASPWGLRRPHRPRRLHDPSTAAA